MCIFYALPRMTPNVNSTRWSQLMTSIFFEQAEKLIFQVFPKKITELNNKLQVHNYVFSQGLGFLAIWDVIGSEECPD